MRVNTRACANVFFCLYDTRDSMCIRMRVYVRVRACACVYLCAFVCLFMRDTLKSQELFLGVVFFFSPTVSVGSVAVNLTVVFNNNNTEITFPRLSSLLRLGFAFLLFFLC